MAPTINKDVVKALVDRMPENATLDDLVEEICVMIAVERGMADVAAGRTHSHQEVLNRFGLRE